MENSEFLKLFVFLSKIDAVAALLNIFKMHLLRITVLLIDMVGGIEARWRFRKISKIVKLMYPRWWPF